MTKLLQAHHLQAEGAVMVFPQKAGLLLITCGDETYLSSFVL